jgi:hypothetical protein
MLEFGLSDGQHDEAAEEDGLFPIGPSGSPPQETHQGEEQDDDAGQDRHQPAERPSLPLPRCDLLVQVD